MPRKSTQQTVLTPASESTEALAQLAADPALAPSAPATPTPAKQTPAERKAARLLAEAATRAAGGVVLNAAGRPTARDLPCLCGCGDQTHRPDAWFLSGHDAKLRKAVVDGGLTVEQVPAVVRPFFELGAPLAGLLLQEDGTFADLKAGR